MAEHWEFDFEATPGGDRAAADDAYRQWQRAVERSKGWAQEAERKDPQP